MRIAYLHGLESSIDPKDPKIIWLNDNFDQVYTPQINYKNKGSFNTILRTIKKMDPHYIVGSSMGGYFAYIIGSKLGIKTILFNPAVVGRSFDPVVDLTGMEGRNGHNIFLGRNDKVISGSDIRKFFGESGMANINTEYYEGGHRVPVDVFINSIKKVSGVSEIYNVENKLNIMKNFKQFVNEKKASFSQIKKDTKTKEYKEVSRAIDGAMEVSDIWNMLDPKMFEFTEEEFEEIFDEWYNNVSGYYDFNDFTRNCSLEDAHSLYLHLLPYLIESNITEATDVNDPVLIRIRRAQKHANDMKKLDAMKKEAEKEARRNKPRWTQKKYDKWLETVASNGGAENAFDMAKNAEFEPGLIDWVKKQFRGDDPLQRIQWDIEAFAESVVTEAKFVKDFNRDVLDAKTKEEVLELYPNAEFFIGKSDHFFGEFDENLFFKAYYTKGQKEFEIKSVYSEKGSNYVHLYNESIVNENYEVIFSDGMSQMKKFRNERQALDFMKKTIASNKKLRDIAVYKPGMHSTTQTELVVAFWGDGSYLDNVSKRDKDLAAKKLEESLVNEAEVTMDAIDPKNKSFLKFLKKHNVKITDSVKGPNGIEITMHGKREDLENVLADGEYGWDDPGLADYIEESVITESEKIYHKYDFEGMWAQKLGMTREEYVAHFATMTVGVDEAKATDYAGIQFEVKGIGFTYTDVGRFYGVYLYDEAKTANVQWRAKLSLSEITEFLTSIKIKNTVPVRYDEKELSAICKKLTKAGIVCDFNDSMDVS